MCACALSLSRNDRIVGGSRCFANIRLPNSTGATVTKCLRQRLQVLKHTTAAKVDKQLHSCGACGKALTAKASKCSRCRVVYYCDAECQKAHWKRHKLVCGKAGGDVAGALLPLPSRVPRVWIRYCGSQPDLFLFPCGGVAVSSVSGQPLPCRALPQTARRRTEEAHGRVW